MTRLTFGLLATLTALVLLFAYHTSLAGPLPYPAPSSSPTTVAQTSAKASAAPSRSKLARRTVSGDRVKLRSGAIQVRVVVSGRKVTAVDAAVTSADGTPSRASNAAVAALAKEAVAAQSAKVATVSGAPSVSDGFRRSLQSALDRAGL